MMLKTVRSSKLERRERLISGSVGAQPVRAQRGGRVGCWVGVRGKRKGERPGLAERSKEWRGGSQFFSKVAMRAHTSKAKQSEPGEWSNKEKS